MRITFIYLDLATDEPTYAGYFYHGIASLSAVLKKAGYQTSLIQLTKEISTVQFQEKIKKLDPDLIAFSSTSHMFPLVRKYAAVVKKITKTPIICGGVHASICPEEVVSDQNIDMACIGEGELTFLELCQKLERGQNIEDIKNIWIKKEGVIYRNEIRPLILNLNELPFPDREIFDYPNLNLEKRGIGTFMFSRGCPYRCAFCCHPTLRKLYPNPKNYFRFRSPDLAIQEIKQVIKRYPFIKFVRLDDDLLLANMDWVKEFIPRYKKEVNLPFSADLRVNLATEELFDMLKEAGGHLIHFGVESGNNRILKEVLSKDITVQQIKKAFKLAKEKNIKTQSYNIIGVPEESSKEVLDTIKLNAQIKPNISLVSIFYPYRGIALYDYCLNKGYFKKEDSLKIPKNFYSFSVLSLPTIRKAQISFFFRYFHLLKNLYSILYKIPFSKPLIFLSDKFFGWRYTPEIIKITLDPLRSGIRLIRRRIFSTKTFDSEALGKKQQKV